MRMIRIIEQISLDGVIQAPGGPDEDGDYELALVSTKVASSGVVMNTYKPVGALRTGSFAEPPV